MTEDLAAALRPVLRDLRATCSVRPIVRAAPEEGDGGEDMVFFWEADGSGRGIGLWPGHGPADRIAQVAEQASDWAVEALCAALKPAVWPECPVHPDSHPLEAGVRGGVAVWSCPRTGQSVALVGELGKADARGAGA
ncbi:hypothetical protein HUT19_30545 [Streptomyces sp. NA02950]|uniref:hypothetical protein n=1 Tax=Streptomyces sp. NA02950 TaxID=2742137 RepID=UPI0015918D30|nr:hypothetical protein [Streptomyces sp. NA02950]QKV95544.1 hypothetical protein HUT19_30545 [Streptomyces sp. NA02950]